MVMVIVRLLLGANHWLRGMRVDDRRVVSGTVQVIRNRLRWWDAPAVYGPRKKLYNRVVRWPRTGIFAHLAAESGLSAS
jgi:transposase